MKRVLALFLFVSMPVFTFSQEVKELFTVDVPIELAGDAFALGAGEVELQK